MLLFLLLCVLGVSIGYTDADGIRTLISRLCGINCVSMTCCLHQDIHPEREEIWKVQNMLYTGRCSEYERAYMLNQLHNC
jgi:hypothetical protein